MRRYASYTEDLCVSSVQVGRCRPTATPMSPTRKRTPGGFWDARASSCRRGRRYSPRRWRRQYRLRARTNYGHARGTIAGTAVGGAGERGLERENARGVGSRELHFGPTAVSHRHFLGRAVERERSLRQCRRTCSISKLPGGSPFVHTRVICLQKGCIIATTRSDEGDQRRSKQPRHGTGRRF
jgi:hypothetical protein